MFELDRVKIILDITPFKNGFYADASRSGIFFTIKNVLSELLKRADVELYFNISCYEPDSFVKTALVIGREFPENAEFILSRLAYDRGVLSGVTNKLFRFLLSWKERCRHVPFAGVFLSACNFLLRRIVGKISGFPAGKICGTEEWNGGSFLSLMYAIPEHVKAIIPAERRFTLLYDTIPTVCAGKVADNPWYNELTSKLSAQENYLAISSSTAGDFKRLFSELSNKDIPVVMLAAGKGFSPEADMEKAEKIRKKYNISKSKKIIFSHCSFAPHKNLERLLKAFVRFSAAREDYQIVFGGSAAGVRKTQLLESAGVDSERGDIIFTGYLDDDEVPELYRMAEIFVFVSLYEGFGLPVLEAMSCGTPSLVSRTSSIPEVAGDAALTVDPYDEDAIFTGLERLASSPELRTEMRQKGFVRAAGFSWSSTTETIVKYIAEKRL